MNDWGHVLIRGLAMAIEPHNNQDRLGALLLRRRNDESLVALLPLLEEVAALPDDELHRQEIHNILRLRKENAKLRELAVKLSNLLGDLPAGEWEDAVAHAYGPPMRFDRYGRRSTVRGSQCRQGRGSFDLDHAVLKTIPA